jgi:hypothetical protein
MSLSLDVASLAAEARSRAGAQPDEPLSYLDGLGVLTAALDGEARLTADGRRSARAVLVLSLTTQLQVAAMMRDHPQISQIDVRPVFITGLPRTGTTFLQHMLAQHPDLRCPQLWELMAPASGEPVSRLVAECEAFVRGWNAAAPAMHAIHPIGARLPDECSRLTRNSFRDRSYLMVNHVPSYVRWLREQSMTPAYEFHAAQLRCLLWRCPGRPVMLKGPLHLWFLQSLGQVYPGARVIRLHRSPAEALPSMCSLTEVVRRARSGHADRAEIGRYWLEEAAGVLAGLRRGDGPLSIPPPLDITFSELNADPLGVAAQVCDYVGVPLTSQARERMAKFQAAAGGGRGRHRYRAADYGLDERDLRERFGAYLAEFKLDP